MLFHASFLMEPRNFWIFNWGQPSSRPGFSLTPWHGSFCIRTKYSLKNYGPVSRGILDNASRCFAPKNKKGGDKKRRTLDSCCFLFQLNNIIRASLEDHMHVPILKLYCLAMYRKIKTGLTSGKNSQYPSGPLLFFLFNVFLLLQKSNFL